MSSKDDVDGVDAGDPVYKTLLESTKAIPWKIDWNSMTFAYIGPQIETLLGWSPESWASVNDWVERIHPDDREYVVNYCVSQSKSGVDHEADYRALTKDGGYVWIRDVVHVVRNSDGEVESLVGFMFDISERKKTEEKLLTLQKELEELSFNDGLTGISNRRKFDMIMQTEWNNARRTRQPLSVMLIDIDFFKQYNDFYGHLQGDDCIRLVAQLLNSAVARPRDLVARFGGEEFVMVLPETDHASALRIANKCQRLIQDQKIPHEKSSVSDLVTVSVGVSTIIPEDNKLDKFIKSVDRLLYKAKKNGRNRIEVNTEASS
ncbi:MAG: diguanylate cyclase [Gammaproteobacteria bacterium]|nr:diguanylate cyclase [Gammaproteobacteria bacterium]